MRVGKCSFPFYKILQLEIRFLYHLNVASLVFIVVVNFTHKKSDKKSTQKKEVFGS